MEVVNFIPLLVFLSLTCFVMANANNETLTIDVNTIEENTGLSESEKEELHLKALEKEGTPGWFKKYKKVVEKMPLQSNRQKDSKPAKELYDLSAPPTKLITAVKTKLATFTGPLADRVKGSISGLNKKWKGLDNDQRKDAIATMGVISTNIEKFGNAGEDPVGAIKGAVDIIASIASNFGPKGQLISLGLGFVSALLGLFGKGSKPKPMSEIVREQINKALAEYREAVLTAQAEGLVQAFKESKAYLNGAAKSGKPLSDKEMVVLGQRVPIRQGSKFMGELSSVIRRMFTNNKAADGKRCIKYCELYARLATIRDMILTQLISMTPSTPDWQNDVNGLTAHRDAFRETTRLLFKRLYTVDYDSNILPYFDPDVSSTTDAYSTKMWNLAKYDRSGTGLYCLMTPGRGGIEELTWSQEFQRYKMKGNPYITIVKPSNNNCFWKLVPHGQNTYSIFNKYKCKEKHAHCNKMLSWSADGNEAFADISSDDPVLWEILGSQWRIIRSKWGCGKIKSKWCNYELKVKHKERWYFLDRRNIPVGQLRASDGKYYSVLRKKP